MKTFKRRWFWHLCWFGYSALAVVPAGVLAETVTDKALPRSSRPAQPLLIRNNSPLAQLYGQPAFRGAVADRQQIRFSIAAANSFSASNQAGEVAVFDGETARFDYQYVRPLGVRWELGASVPWIVHSGGRFDGLIDVWHDLFGLPDGGRPNLPRGRIDYFIDVADDTEPGVAIDSKASDLGDISAWVGYQLWQQPGRSLTARGQLKLPTGTASVLSGSGATDVSLSIDYLDTQLLSKLATTVSFGVGVSRLGAGDLLPTRQRDWLWYGHFGLATRLGRYVELVGQLDGHRAPFQADISELGTDVLQGTLGGRVHLTPKLSFELAVVEDLSSRLAADVVFQVSLLGRF